MKSIIFALALLAARVSAQEAQTAASVYDAVPFSEFQAGGYAQLQCGYGHVKAADGTCQPETWVSFPWYLMGLSRHVRMRN